MPISLGNVAPILDGAWSSSKTYARNTVVTNGGSSYISRKAVPAGTVVTNTAYWMICAEKGDIGPQGNPGIPAVTGATSGNFPALNSSGNLTDSGKNAADFFTSAPDATLLAVDSKWGVVARYTSPVTTAYNGQICDAFRVLTRTGSGVGSGFGIFSIDIRNNGNQTYMVALKNQIPLPPNIEAVALVTVNASTLTVDILMRTTINPATVIVYSLGSFQTGTFTKTYMGSVTPSNVSLPTATATVYPEMQTATYSSLTLLNSYTGWIHYTKSASSLVTVRFNITPGTTTAATQISQITSGNRPGVNCAFPLRNNTSGAVANFYVATTGYIYNIDALSAGVNYSGSYTYLAE